MKIVWNTDHIRAIHSDDQDLTGLYPGNVILRASTPPRRLEDGSLAPDQDPAFLSATGLERVDGAWRISDGGMRAVRIDDADTEASRRRQAVLDGLGRGGTANLMSLVARSLRAVRREAKGRAQPDEVARLDQLEALAGQLEAIDTARDAIIAEIEASPDPASYDVIHSPHWPE